MPKHAPADLDNLLTACARRVLDRLVRVLEVLGVPYQITGGLAGNFHGSRWPLADIDLELPREAMAAVGQAFGGEVSFGPARYRDEEFELDLLQLTIEGIPVDVNAVEGLWVATPAGWVPIETDLSAADTFMWAGREVRVQPLAALIAYKRLLGREADLADLLTLEPTGGR